MAEVDSGKMPLWRAKGGEVTGDVHPACISRSMMNIRRKRSKTQRKHSQPEGRVQGSCEAPNMMFDGGTALHSATLHAADAGDVPPLGEGLAEADQTGDSRVVWRKTPKSAP